MDGKAGQSGNEEQTYFLNLLDIVFPVTLQALLSFLGESEGREGEESLIIKWELAAGKYDPWSFEEKRN